MAYPCNGGVGRSRRQVQSPSSEEPSLGTIKVQQKSDAESGSPSGSYRNPGRISEHPQTHIGARVIGQILSIRTLSVGTTLTHSTVTGKSYRDHGTPQPRTGSDGTTHPPGAGRTTSRRQRLSDRDTWGRGPGSGTQTRPERNGRRARGAE